MTKMNVATIAAISEINFFSGLLTLLIRDKLFMKLGLHKFLNWKQA